MFFRYRLALGLALFASAALADGGPPLPAVLTPAAYARLGASEQAQYVRFYRGQATRPFLIELRRNLPAGIGTVSEDGRAVPVFVVRSAEQAGRLFYITQYGRGGRWLRETAGPR